MNVPIIGGAVTTWGERDGRQLWKARSSDGNFVAYFTTEERDCDEHELSVAGRAALEAVRFGDTP